MKAHAFSRLSEFLKTTETFLEQNEVFNHLMLGIANRFDPETDIPSDCLLVMITDEMGEIRLAGVQSSGKEIIINGDAEAGACLLQYYLDQNIPLHGMEGPRPLIEAIGKIWEEQFNGNTQVDLEHLIYALYEVNSLDTSPGSMRVAEPKDIDLLTQWSYDFQVDAFDESHGDLDLARKTVQTKIERKTLFVWENEGPVSMAAFARPGKTGVAINYVFTPKAFRKKGYARSLTAALSQEMLNRGFSFCTLFTDVHNPTSNKIYQEVGYECKGEFLKLILSMAD
jgi:hypothetical protein